MSELKEQLKSLINIYDQIDSEDAASRIKSNIWFKGPNVWILTFSIVIASVGLNVNSTAVIIGAMLISPLMGPITGIGLALGTNDLHLMRNALRNLLIMIAISLIASCLYFLVSPLNLANPTELESRTSPTIYDVLIALFGGLAGILESSRKEKGTVLAGVAIATALMPPLCTAGYGLANLNLHFFFGAFFLFLINCVFITLATYVMVKYLRFPQVTYLDSGTAHKTKIIMTIVTLAVIIPSIWSAFSVVAANNFTKNVEGFIASNKMMSHAYIYDYKVYKDGGQKVDIFCAGDPLSQSEKDRLVASAERHNIKPSQLTIKENAFGARDSGTEKVLKGIYERTDAEVATKNARIDELEKQLDEIKGSRIPYSQIAKELRYSFPDVSGVSILKGAQVDTLGKVSEHLTVIASTTEALPAIRVRKLEDWLKIRMNDSTAVVYNNVIK